MLRFLFSFLSVITLLTAPALGAEKPVVDIPALIRQDKAIAVKSLGKPKSCKMIRYGEKCTFRGEHEIVFINGKADWFTVQSGAKYSPGALESIGFRIEMPDDINDSGMYWHQGMRSADLAATSSDIPVESISVFRKGKDKISYIYVKATTR